MSVWDDLVEKDRELIEQAALKASQGFQKLPSDVQTGVEKGLVALNAPLAGLGGLAALGQGRGLQEAAQGIREGKTIGNYLTEAIPEPESTSTAMNILGNVGRSGAGLATDFGAGVIGPIELGMAGVKGAKAALPALEELVAAGTPRRSIGRGLGRAAESGKALVPGIPEKLPIDRESNIAKFMEGSKVVTPEGTPKTVYSGHSNVGMYGKEFNPKKATSGAFYATEDPSIASNYAIGKIGIKETFENGSEYRIKGKGGKFNKKLWQIDLTPEQLDNIEKFSDEELGLNMREWAEQNAKYDKTAARLKARPNNLQNIYDFMNEMGYTIHNSVDDANAFPRYTSSHFEDTLDRIGVKWDSFTAHHPGVMPVHMNIKNPLDTSKPFPPELLADLKKAVKGTRHKPVMEALDARWTNEYPLRNWVEDIEKGDEYWATQIPKKAIPIFKKHGYDGIMDVGGKGGGPEHPVWISFDPTQIKSSIGNVGTFDPTNPNITKGLAIGATGVGALGAATNQKDTTPEEEYNALMDIIQNGKR